MITLKKFVYRERSFLMPKEDHLAQDWWGRSLRRGVWVLCDGASEGYDGREWARYLCQSAVRFGSFRRAVEHARLTRSLRFPEQYLLNDSDWASVLAREKGSYSTLLRVQVLPRSVEVEGIGDTVAFFLKGHELVYGFPFLDAGFFQKDPLLLSDRPEEEIPPISVASFPWRKQRITSLLLATDAIALFLVSLQKEEQKKILTLLHGGRETQIRKFFKEEIAQKRLRWDDLSYLWLDLRLAGNRGRTCIEFDRRGAYGR